MPVVYANVWEDFRKEKAKSVIKGITKIFVDIDIPAPAVEVIINEIPNYTGELEENLL